MELSAAQKQKILSIEHTEFGISLNHAIPMLKIFKTYVYGYRTHNHTYKVGCLVKVQPDNVA